MEWQRVPTRDERLRQLGALLARAYVVTGPSIEKLCRGIHPDSADEHIVICPVCGQMLDCRDQDQVAHHSTSEHKPKLFI